MNRDSNMDSIQSEIGDWAESTFDHTVKTVTQHMIREVTELGLAAGLQPLEILEEVMHQLNKPAKGRTIDEEQADVQILQYTLANLCGHSLADATGVKHVVNKARSWGAKDSRGISEHVEEQEV